MEYKKCLERISREILDRNNKANNDITQTNSLNNTKGEKIVYPDPENYKDNEESEGSKIRKEISPDNHEEVKKLHGSDLIKHNLVRFIKTQQKQKIIDNA